MAKKTVINASIKDKVKVKMLQFFNHQPYVKNHLNAKLRYNNIKKAQYLINLKAEEPLEPRSPTRSRLPAFSSLPKA